MTNDNYFLKTPGSNDNHYLAFLKKDYVIPF